MAVDEELNERLREALGGLPGISEKKMMGGVCFLLEGNMIGGAHRDKTSGDRLFMFRVGKDNEAQARTMPGGIPMVMGGRRMGGMFQVPEEDCTDAVLKDWVSLAVSHAGSLPPK